MDAKIIFKEFFILQEISKKCHESKANKKAPEGALNIQPFGP